MSQPATALSTSTTTTTTTTRRATTYPLSKYALSSLTNLIDCLDAGTLVPVNASGEHFVREVDKLRSAVNNKYNYAAGSCSGNNGGYGKEEEEEEKDDFFATLHAIFNVLELATRMRDEEGIVPLATGADHALIQAAATAGTMRRFPPRVKESMREAREEGEGEDKSKADVEAKEGDEGESGGGSVKEQQQRQRRRPPPKRIGKGKLRAKMLWRDL